MFLGRLAVLHLVGSPSRPQPVGGRPILREQHVLDDRRHPEVAEMATLAANVLLRHHFQRPGRAVVAGRARTGDQPLGLLALLANVQNLLRTLTRHRQFAQTLHSKTLSC